MISCARGFFARLSIINRFSKTTLLQKEKEGVSKHTYPLTAMRMLRELGGIRDGVCIDIGCGPGMLAVELAKRSEFKIIGLDIDPDQKPLFEKRIQEAGLDKRVSFVLGDAQELPFPDNSADAIVSRGTLTSSPTSGNVSGRSIAS